MPQFTKQDLLSVISNYQAAVAQAVNWLQRKDFSDIFLALDRSGYIDHEQNIRYAFHGYGCLVVMNDVSVNFNFGSNRRIDGFDPWFVYDFCEQSEPAKLIDASYPEVLQLIEELVHDGIIIQPLIILEDGTSYSENLYYLTTDWHNPNPPTFELVCKQFEDLTGDSAV